MGPIHPSELFRDFAKGQPIDTLIRHQESYLKKDEPSPVLPPLHLTPTLSNRLVSEAGSVDAAWEKAQELPDSPSRELILMDLGASRLMRAIIANDGFDPGLAEDYRQAFLAATPTGQQQFLTTLGIERTSGHKNIEFGRDAGLNQFTKELRGISQANHDTAR